MEHIIKTQLLLNRALIFWVYAEAYKNFNLHSYHIDTSNSVTGISTTFFQNLWTHFSNTLWLLSKILKLFNMSLEIVTFKFANLIAVHSLHQLYV